MKRLTTPGSIEAIYARPPMTCSLRPTPSLLLSIFLAGFALLTSCSQPEPTVSPRTASPFVRLKPGHPASAFENLIRKVAGSVAEGDPVGSELLIVKKGNPIYQQSWGFLNRESRTPWKENAICRIRTLSKPILATAILLLHERGRLTLDDQLESYLPEFDALRWGKFTLGQLLSETAGPNPSGSMPPDDSYESLEQLVLDIAKRGPTTRSNRDRPPNLNYNVLGLVLERASGMPADEFLQTRIFKPLGMTDSHCSYRNDMPWRDRLASSYKRTASGLGFQLDRDNTRNSQLPFFAPSNGIFSTVSDYARFILLWQNRGRVGGRVFLSAALIDRAHRVQDDREERPGAHSYAFEIFGYRELGSPLPAPYGQMGSDESVVLVSPQNQLIFVYFTQSRGGDSARAFADELAEKFRFKRTPIDSSKSDEDRLTRPIKRTGKSRH